MTSNNALKFCRHLQIGENYTIMLKTTLRLERKITNDSNTSYANYVTKVRSFRMFSLH